MTRFILPFTAAITFQLFWNLILAFHLGDNTPMGNWLYSRNCGRHWNCDGIFINILIIAAIIIVGELIAIVHKGNKSNG